MRCTMPESNIPTNNNPPEFQGEIEINQQVDATLYPCAVKQVIASILTDHGFRDGSISVAVVDDPTIHRLNVEYLQHDYATDVLSFTLASDADRGWLEGEVIVSYDTATKMAEVYQWTPWAELILYIIHGTLHLVGMEDHTETLKKQMQVKETEYLLSLGLERSTTLENETQ